MLCEGIKQELIKMSGIEEEHKYCVIPNMVPYTKTENIVKKNMVLWVGNFDLNVKRPDLALEIWTKIYKNHKDWDLYLLGDGPAYEEMKKYSEILSLKNIHFEGRVNPDPYYQEAKMIFVTSTHESFSLVTVEAMSHKCVPIVFNSFPAASKIIANKQSGLLISPFSKDEFSEQVSLLMSDSRTLSALSEGAQIAATNYTPEKIYILWEYLLQNLTCE